MQSIGIQTFRIARKITKKIIEYYSPLHTLPKNSKNMEYILKLNFES
jgi:hypothetical protein